METIHDSGSRFQESGRRFRAQHGKDSLDPVCGRRLKHFTVKLQAAIFVSRNSDVRQSGEDSAAGVKRRDVP